MHKLSYSLLPLIVAPAATQASQTAEAFVSGTATFAAFLCVLVVGWVSNWYIFRLLRVPPQDKGATAWGLSGKWELAPVNASEFSMKNLALWSLLSLFLELLMIRWISSEIRIFAYFKNFVLIACFSGFGLGCYLSRRRASILVLLTPLLVLTTLIAFPSQALRLAIGELPSFIAEGSGAQIWFLPTEREIIPIAAATLVIVLLFGLIAAMFIPIGQCVGRLLEIANNGILAYSVNVAAAILGIALYSLLCFWYQPPASWFAIAGLLLVWLLWSNKRLRWASAIVFTVCIALLLLPAGKNSRVFWSPYQKLVLSPLENTGRLTGYLLQTNGAWYQQILNLSPEFVQSHPQLFEHRPIEWNPYNLPYRFFPQPPTVLILGSGMGNDVAAALRNSASSITAVEIDPLILALGKEFHFEKPYASPRVRVIQDDARHYAQNSSDRFDLIVFSLLDSHTTNSNFTNIRIDNYVYTREGLEAAKRLLKPDGVFIVKFQVNTPWIAGRLHGLLQEVFGHPPVQVRTEDSEYTTGGMFFVTGSERQISHALSDQALARYVAEHQQISMERAILTDDDWPYFYQKGRGVPVPILIISAVLVFICAALLRDTGTSIGSLHWHFFFLGAGFLLLEAQIVSKFALLFGTTWLVNSIVITALLLFVLAANFIAAWLPRLPMLFVYTALFATLLLGFLIPLRNLLFESFLWTAVTATLVLALPVFFASVVFIRSFARAGFQGEALGSNLLGAMVGGMLESVSMWTGIRSLLLLAAALYLLSWIALRWEARREVSRTMEAPVSANA